MVPPKAVLLVLALAMLMPSAQAAITISTDSSADNPTDIPYGGSGDIKYTVTATCDEFVTGTSQSLTVDVAVSGVDWISGSDSVTLAPSGCAPSGPSVEVSADGTLTVSANTSAPGVTPTDVTLQIADGGDSTTAVVIVAYNAHYAFSTDGTFPMEVGRDPVSWNFTLDVSEANAPTMVMFNFDGPDVGSVSGLPPGFATFAAPAAETPKTYLITFTPPETGDWENATYSFTTFAHWRDAPSMEEEGVATEPETVEWSFTRGASTNGGGDDGGEDSPGAGVLFVTLALVVAGIAMRRRRI